MLITVRQLNQASSFMIRPTLKITDSPQLSRQYQLQLLRPPSPVNQDHPPPELRHPQDLEAQALVMAATGAMVVVMAGAMVEGVEALSTLR
jgi:hypothetical protein